MILLKTNHYTNENMQRIEEYVDIQTKKSSFMAVVDVLMVIPPGFPMKETNYLPIEAATIEEAYQKYDQVIEHTQKELNKKKLSVPQKPSDKLLV